MKTFAFALAALSTLAAAPAAHAFCGFYVASGNQQMFDDATQVVMMRKGTRTVLSIENNYQGPPDEFALVVPVPVVVHAGDVKTLPKEVFAHVEQMGAPRLVEYWEQDPCAVEMGKDEAFGYARRGGVVMAAAPMATHSLGVTIEAKFVVGEYQILILSAKDSTGLETWLHQEHYNIPAGAEPLLRPYVEAGEKFFVAKVDPKKVKFVNGRAELSPLRVHYDTDRFELPIRLGLANSSGTQDLIVNILAPNQRYEVANYPNITIPTNLDVKDSVKARFGAFYTALFDATLERHPGSVVTEYAWQANTCDPCPGPALGPADFQLLGADVIDGTGTRPSRSYYGYGNDFVLTRLHLRYGKDLKDDLVFKEAPPIAGGREFVTDPKTGRLETGAHPDQVNNFQGRYAIRHPWTGPIACSNPRRGVWGGPPNGAPQQTIAATNLAFAPRGAVNLPAAVDRDVPEIGVVASSPAGPGPSQEVRRRPEAPVTYRPAKTTGCDAGGGPAGPAAGLVLVGLALARPRRRPVRPEEA